MVQASRSPGFLPEIAAMPPFLVTERLQLAAMIAASCRCPPTAAQLRAPIDSRVAAKISSSVQSPIEISRFEVFNSYSQSY